MVSASIQSEYVLVYSACLQQCVSIWLRYSQHHIFQCSPYFSPLKFETWSPSLSLFIILALQSALCRNDAMHYTDSMYSTKAAYIS